MQCGHSRRGPGPPRPPSQLAASPAGRVFFWTSSPSSPKGSFQVVASASYLKDVCFICSHHRVQSGNSSPSQRPSLQRVTTKRLSRMTCPSTVRAEAGAGARRGPSTFRRGAGAGSRGQPGLLPASLVQVENWPQSTELPFRWGAETYRRPSPPARRGRPGPQELASVPDAPRVPAWVWLDSAQKCVRTQVCWRRGTRPLGARAVWPGRAQAQFPGLFHWTKSYCLAPTRQAHFQESGTRELPAEPESSAGRQQRNKGCVRP